MLKPSTSVIIVSFNTIEKLRQCLECLDDRLEVIVVDNASSDESAEMVETHFPWVKLIRSNKNIGFGPANNLGCKAASGDLVLFLNSDAYADPASIEVLAASFSNPEVVGAGGKLLNPDRSLQLSTANRLTLWAVFCEQLYLEKIFSKSGLFSPYWTTNRLALNDSPSETAQVMGACLMVRAVDGQPLEAFDERYFLYCEDTDLCRRLQVHGKIVYVPQATFVHELGSSSKKDPALGIIRYNMGKELYFRIHHGAFASIVCLILDRIGAWLRFEAWAIKWALSLFRNQHAQAQVRCFRRVFRGK